LRHLEGAAAVRALYQPAVAARIAGGAAALREELGIAFFPGEREWLERRLAAARERLGGERFTAARAEGRWLPLEHVVELAVATSEVRNA
jgi:hypothetical protein